MNQQSLKRGSGHSESYQQTLLVIWQHEACPVLLCIQLMTHELSMSRNTGLTIENTPGRSSKINRTQTRLGRWRDLQTYTASLFTFLYRSCFNMVIWINHHIPSLLNWLTSCLSNRQLTILRCTSFLRQNQLLSCLVHWTHLKFILTKKPSEVRFCSIVTLWKPLMLYLLQNWLM